MSGGTQRSNIPAPIQHTADAHAIPTSVSAMSILEVLVDRAIQRRLEAYRAAPAGRSRSRIGRVPPRPRDCRPKVGLRLSIIFHTAFLISKTALYRTVYHKKCRLLGGKTYNGVKHQKESNKPLSWRVPSCEAKGSSEEERKHSRER